MIHRLPREVIQRVDAGDDGGERRGNLRIGGVCPVVFAIHVVLVNLSVDGSRA